MEQLRKLGLGKYESEIYSCLLKLRRAGAKDISEKSKVPVTAVYPNLKSLIEKQLVQEVKGEISLFELINPKIALKSFIEKREKEIAETGNELLDYIKGIEKETVEKPREVIELSHGKDVSARIYYDAMKRARESFYILGWRFYKVEDKYIFLRELKKLVKKRVDVRIILTGTFDKKFDLIEDYKNSKIKMRYLPLDNFSIFIMDARECKITLKDKNLPKRYNIHILDKNLASALNLYFLERWKIAREI
jgi:sugar-specific transcriptional regulator TrmB